MNCQVGVCLAPHASYICLLFQHHCPQTAARHSPKALQATAACAPVQERSVNWQVSVHMQYQNRAVQMPPTCGCARRPCRGVVHASMTMHTPADVSTASICWSLVLQLTIDDALCRQEDSSTESWPDVSTTVNASSYARASVALSGHWLCAFVRRRSSFCSGCHVQGLPHSTTNDAHIERLSLFHAFYSELQRV